MATQPTTTMVKEEKKSDPQDDPQATISTAGNPGEIQNISALNLASSVLPPAFSALPQQNAAQLTLQSLDANAIAALTQLLTSNPALLNTLVAQQQQQQQQQAAAALLAAAAPLTHNLIPQHLQYSLAASLNGTPGYPPALIPPLLAVPSPIPQPAPVTAFQSMTLQDRLIVEPTYLPQYNGINPNYPGVRVLSSDPPVFAVDNFLTPLECQFLVTVASDSFGPAPVVGKGAGEISASRTSSTCYLAREDLPDYMRKVSLLTGKPIEHCELPQVGRYLPSQQYLQHFDAFDTSNEDGRRFASNGGQRTITVLVYLNDVMRGGATRFPALNLDVQPRQGMALVFFPATIDGLLDKRALHAAMPAVDPKFVSQVWIRQTNYNGQPSKRLNQIMGTPLQPLQSAGVAPQTPIAPLAGVAPVPPQQQQQPQQQQPPAAASATTQAPLASGTSSNGSMIPNPLAANNLPATF